MKDLANFLGPYADLNSLWPGSIISSALVAWMPCYSMMGRCRLSPGGSYHLCRKLDDFYDRDVLCGYEAVFLVVS